MIYNTSPVPNAPKASIANKTLTKVVSIFKYAPIPLQTPPNILSFAFLNNEPLGEGSYWYCCEVSFSLEDELSVCASKLISSNCSGRPMLAIIAATCASLMNDCPAFSFSLNSSAILFSMSLMISSLPSSLAKYARRLSMYFFNSS